MVAIGEASRQSGVGIETIRYYEREGIVSTPARTSNGRRIYTKDEIGELTFLKKCRELGFSLSDAKTLLDLSSVTQNDCKAVLKMSERHLENIGSKILELRMLEAALRELTANCSEGNIECPMLSQLRQR